MPQPISFASRDLERELAARTEADSQAARSLTAKRDLERYYETLRRSLPTFTEQEATLIVDALNGTILEPNTVTLLWANVDDHNRLYDGSLPMDVAALVARLRGLSYAECMALADAVERFWSAANQRDSMTLADGLRTVGMVK